MKQLIGLNLRAPTKKRGPSILAVIVLAFATSSCEHRSERRSGQLCILSDGVLNPLLVGQTVQLKIGKMAGSNCLPSDVWADVWDSPQSGVVRVRSDGLVQGVAPGEFRVIARVGPTGLESAGFVLPPGWAPRIDPQDATIRVGETVSYRVVADDADGRPLPPVWFSVYTAEFYDVGSGARPPVDMWSQQNIRTSGVFRGVRPGRTTMIGIIGTSRVETSLTVTSSD